jgi:hypothetical protein
MCYKKKKSTYDLERRRRLEDFEGVDKQPPISNRFVIFNKGRRLKMRCISRKQVKAYF